MMRSIGLHTLHSLLVLVWALPLHGRVLTEAQLFYRCYSQLTQLYPAPNHPLLLDVKSGAKTAVEACEEVFAKASFTADQETTIADTNDPEARAVLRTFHKLHSAWFGQKQFPESGANGIQDDAIKQMFDASSPALYFTRSLFKPNLPLSSVLTSNEHLNAIRTGHNPDKDLANRLKSQYVFKTQTRFPDKGILLGVEMVANQAWNYEFVFRGQNKSGVAAVLTHFGGGVIGSHPYLLLNLEETFSFKADGAVAMPRKWARHLVNDLLCRDLPVVRQADANPFVVDNAEAEFRRAASCTACHATIDRMSAVIRSFDYINLGVSAKNGIPASYGGYFATFRPATAAAETGWPAQADASYVVRPPNGVLYLRDYKGNLVDLPVNGLTQLATRLSQLEDFYVCTAKRYYEYFTGISIPLQDPGDPAALTLSPLIQSHYQNVVALGQQLKTHQNPAKTIADILKLNVYRDSGFAP